MAPSDNKKRRRAITDDNDDIYNMNEPALYWKANPDATSAIELTSCNKSSKARITINLCCNSTGNRLSPWYIGTAQKPRCFSSSTINIDNLSMKWRSNKKGWMTGAIMKEYIFLDLINRCMIAIRSNR